VTFEPSEAFRTLNRHEVRYVLIGGLASEFLGSAIATNDIDICYERTPANMDRLAAALQDLHATLRVAGLEEDLPFVLDGRTLAAGDSFTFKSDAGDLDVLGTPSGTGGFKDLDVGATSYDLGEGLVVRVVALEDLIRMKEAAGRPKDQAHLHILTALRDEIDQADRPFTS
jgi:hypothetical protein